MNFYQCNDRRIGARPIHNRALAEPSPRTRRACFSLLACTKRVHYRLWSFKTSDTKLERIFHKNQHTQRRKLSQKLGIVLGNKVL